MSPLWEENEKRKKILNGGITCHSTAPTNLHYSVHYCHLPLAAHHLASSVMTRCLNRR